VAYVLHLLVKFTKRSRSMFGLVAGALGGGRRDSVEKVKVDIYTNTCVDVRQRKEMARWVGEGVSE